MKRMGCLIALIILFAVGCGVQPSPAPTAEPPTAPPPTATLAQAADTPLPPTEAPTETPEAQPEPDTPVPPSPTEASEPVDDPGLSLPADRGELFAGSGLCAACHTNMVDGSGNDVSIDTAWRASMMANAARDPYWRASVRGEVLSNPKYQAVIEKKCATCHMPMAQTSVAAQGEEGQILDGGFASPDHGLHNLAIDGVSCTLCHQIRQDGFGEHASYSGGYTIDTLLPMGEREAFGIFRAGRKLVQTMQAGSGFVPVQSSHVEQAELCATCHNLYTPYLDAADEVAGEFPEQTPHLEWQASSFGNGAPCQSCHMPQARGNVRLSITGGPPRSPFHQHLSVGGNVYVLELFETFGLELAATASSAQFRDTGANTLVQLESRTASLSIKDASIDDSSLIMAVSVIPMTGHKLPTSFPSRRVWLHVVVEDAAGQVLYESGAANPDGSIAGNDNDADPAAYEPHYQMIDSPDQVQIYEAIMGDTEDQVTTVLLRGAQYLKDNRLPPAGFDKATVHQDIAVYGTAWEDPDFDGGGDRTQYIVDLGQAPDAVTVTVELLYQSIGFRWADNLRAYDAPEPARFVGYYDQVANQPVVIASASVEIGQ